MNEPIKLDRGETVSIAHQAGAVQLHLAQGFLQMSKRLTPAQAEAIGGQLIQAAKGARASLLPSKPASCPPCTGNCEQGRKCPAKAPA